MEETSQVGPGILIVSDSRTTTGALTMFSLEQQSYRVAIEQIPAKAVERMVEVMPDLIVLDLNYPVSLTKQLVRSLREETAVPILLVTGTVPEPQVVEIYEAGVDELLHKPVSPSLFLAKIRVWLRRSPTAPVHGLLPLKMGEVELRPVEHAVILGNAPPIKLTNLELRLLHALLSRPRQIVRAEDLIREVWGDQGRGDRVMLKNLVYRLRRKLEDGSKGYTMIQTSGRDGYRFVPV